MKGDILSEPYVACIVQPEQIVPSGKHEYKKLIQHYNQLIDFTVRLHALRGPVKLIAFPEFLLQGSAAVMTSFDQKKYKEIAVEVPGEEIGLLGEKAKEYKLYLAGATMEYDPEWEGRFFNCAFIVGPDGKVIHKYRKIQTACAIELSTSPHDIRKEYTARYGWEAKTIFPVTSTPIGRLGMYICYDGHFPEVARALALNGAEVLIRPTAYFEPWASEPTDWWTVLNRARAIENMCYVIAPSRGSIVGPGMPREWSSGRSQIIDFEGRILSLNQTTGESTIGAIINIEYLRQRRRKEVMFNHLAHLRTEAYCEIYQKAKCFPDDQWAENPPSNFDDLRRVTEASIEGLLERDIFKA